MFPSGFKDLSHRVTSKEKNFIDRSLKNFQFELETDFVSGIISFQFSVVGKRFQLENYARTIFVLSSFHFVETISRIAQAFVLFDFIKEIKRLRTILLF